MDPTADPGWHTTLTDEAVLEPQIGYCPLARQAHYDLFLVWTPSGRAHDLLVFARGAVLARRPRFPSAPDHQGYVLDLEPDARTRIHRCDGRGLTRCLLDIAAPASPPRRPSRIVLSVRPAVIRLAASWLPAPMSCPDATHRGIHFSVLRHAPDGHPGPSGAPITALAVHYPPPPTD